MNRISSLLSVTFMTRVVTSAALILLLTDCQSSSNHATNSLPGQSWVLETPSSAFSFVNSIGINTHLNYFDRAYGNFAFVEHELKYLGVRHVRDGVHLQGSDYNSLLFSRWERLGHDGISFDALFDPRSRLGNLNSALLQEVYDLSGGSLDAVEGPNEMDVSGEADWPAVESAYQASLFHSAKSDSTLRGLPVIGPSLAFAAHSTQLGNLSGVLDFGNLHPYPAGAMPSVVFPEQVQLEDVICSDKPIVFSETGYHNAVNEQNDQPGISESAAAKYIPRLFLEDFKHGITRTYLYELLDEAPDPSLSHPQFHWGLIRADGTEKPAFHALKNLIDELDDTSQPSSLQPLRLALTSSGASSAPIDHLLLERSDGSYDLVLWEEVPSYSIRKKVDINSDGQDVQLALTTQCRLISVFDPTSQEKPTLIARNIMGLTFHVSDQPVVVHMQF